MNDKTKEFCCQNGHTLGFIRLNGDGVPQLMLCRHATDLQAAAPAEVDVIGPLQGRMPVQCDVPGCGCVRLWDASVVAVADLFLRFDDGQVLAFTQRILTVKRTS